MKLHITLVDTDNDLIITGTVTPNPNSNLHRYDMSVRDAYGEVRHNSVCRNIRELLEIVEDQYSQYTC